MPRLAVYTLLLLLAAPPAAGRSELERLERRHRQWQRGDSGIARDKASSSDDSHEQQAGRRWQDGRCVDAEGAAVPGLHDQRSCEDLARQPKRPSTERRQLSGVLGATAEAPAPLSGLRRNQELRAARNFMGRLGPYMEQHPRASVTERFRGAMADLKGKK